MSQKKRHPVLRVVGIVLLCLLLPVGFGIWYLSRNYKDIIKKQLPKLGQKASDSLYQVQAGDVDIDLINRKVVITDFNLVPDPDHMARLRQEYRLPKMLLSIHIDKLTMDGIAWNEVLFSREVVCSSMEILNPVVRIKKLTDTAAEKRDTAKHSAIQAIKAGSITIINPDILFTTDTTRNATALGGKGGRITLTNWNYDLRNPADSSRLFYSDKTVVALNSFGLNQPNGIYDIGTGAIAYDQSSGDVTVSKIRVKSRLNRDQFYKRIGFQKEMYEVDFPLLSLKAVDWKKLLQGGELIAQGGRLADASINIYMSRVPPLNTQSKNGNFPQQMLMKLALPVYIPQLDIANGRFAYTEKNEKTMQEGTVAMSSINGAVKNITNMPAYLRKAGHLLISMKGIFKGSPIEALFDFTTASKTGAFAVSGKLGSLDGTKLNDIVKPLALAEIQQLQIQGIDFSLSGSEAGARGRITMRYTDLKVALMKMDDGSLNKLGLISFLANGLFIHKSNPSGNGKVRTVTPYYKRDETKSFFNLVWKTIFTGTLQTASKKLLKLDKTVNKRAEKGEEKRLERERGRGKHR